MYEHRSIRTIHKLLAGLILSISIAGVSLTSLSPFVSPFASPFIPPLAQAQPATYLPWQAGVTFRVMQGNHGSYSHNTVYTRYGWDFNLPKGTLVISAAAGRVARAANGYNGGWGNTITVCYGDGTCSRYGHLSSLAVSVGQSVGQAQFLGRSGNSGNSSGPHLHYQLEAPNGHSLPSRFAEAGVPREGNRVTSQNRPSVGDYRGALDTAFPLDKDGVVHIAQSGGSQVPIGFNISNNGSRTWEDFRLVLVNSPPENLRRALGWETLNQIPGDRQRVEPGQASYVRFQLNPEETNPPGDYPFQFRLYDRGTGEWIPGVEPSFVLRVASSCYAAQYVAQSVTPLVAPGGTGHFSLTLKNVGGCVWNRDGQSPVRLGTRDGEPFPYADASWLSNARVVMTEPSVAPGELGHFAADWTVPAGTPAGRRQQYFVPVAEGRQWFGRQIGLFLTFFVGDKDHLPFTPDEYSTPYVSATYLAGALAPGETGEVKMTYRNNGPAVLFADGAAPVRLRGIRPYDRESVFIDPDSPRAVKRPGHDVALGVSLDQSQVNPGEQFSFTVPVKVPANQPSGTYQEYFRPVAEGLTWFGPDDTWWPFTVK